jgi:signal transduction histidine kinase
MIQPVGEKTPKFTFVSRRFREMTGMGDLPLEHGLSLWLSRVHPDDHARWSEMATVDTDRTKQFCFECRLLVNGLTRWVRAEASPRTLRDGSTLWEGVLFDITTVKDTEQRLKTVITASRGMTWVFNLLKGTLTFDEAWTAANGYVPVNFSCDWSDWIADVHPDDIAIVARAFDRLLSGAAMKHTIEYRRRHLSGHWMWFRVHAGVSASDDTGKPVSLSGVTFDITEEMTERQRVLEEKSLLREDLQRAQQRDMMVQIAGRVAHDLNNLISVIAGTTEVLTLLSDHCPETVRGLDRIRRSIDMAQELVVGLGGLGRPEQPRALHDMRKVIVEGIELLGCRRIARHSIQTSLPEIPALVWGNLTELSQIIVNLAINACDSGGDSGDATVRVAVMPSGTSTPGGFPDAGSPGRGGPMTLFTISDDGLGIDDVVRERMFRPHFSTKGNSGTGLGLSIVSSILNANQASLWVDSTVGQGTTITVAWPAERPAVAIPKNLPQDMVSSSFSEPVDLPSLDGMHVLVVDDLEDVGAVLVDMLEAAGATAFAETDPKDAQAILAEAPGFWSVLVTDLHMPGLDGRDLARAAARLSPPIPVVLVTARSELLNESDRELFQAVLAKPVTKEMLSVAVRSAAGRAQFRGHHGPLRRSPEVG